jgi:arabinose-5-phosphate isomerase
MKPEQKATILDKVTKALDSEIESILHFRSLMDPRIADAVELIFETKGKLILTGVGKSGDIAKKLSSTLSSTGTPSLFLHPTDALHGDAGIIQKGDVILAIGKSGESDELNTLLPTAKNIGASIIAITANEESSLARKSDIAIITPILKEACPLDLAPTSSTTIALMLGDAIAMALMELREFKAEDFALYHPAGRLGKRLSLKIDDVMRKGSEIAKLSPQDDLNTLLKEITSKMLGAAVVVDENDKLLGFITDYDIRNKVLTQGLKDPTAEMVMNPNPSYFTSGSSAYHILVSMESRERPISVSPIVNSEKQVVGMITVHDLLQKGL